jgi:hypothetical protein
MDCLCRLAQKRDDVRRIVGLLDGQQTDRRVPAQSHAAEDLGLGAYLEAAELRGDFGGSPLYFFANRTGGFTGGPSPPAPPCASSSAAPRRLISTQQAAFRSAGRSWIRGRDRPLGM